VNVELVIETPPRTIHAAVAGPTVLPPVIAPVVKLATRVAVDAAVVMIAGGAAKSVSATPATGATVVDAFTNPLNEAKADVLAPV
jgi:hypothetical protein